MSQRQPQQIDIKSKYPEIGGQNSNSIKEYQPTVPQNIQNQPIQQNFSEDQYFNQGNEQKMHQQIPLQEPDRMSTQIHDLEQHKNEEELLNFSIFDELQNYSGIYIKEKFMGVEAFIGAELKNEYHVYGTNELGQTTANPIINIKEDSMCPVRFCCPGGCRQYNLKVTEFKGNQQKTEQEKQNKQKKQIFINTQRDYQCTFLCLNRPELLIFEGENRDKLIGKIKHDFKCCGIVMSIEDGKGNLLYKLNAPLCQIGVLGRGFCCKTCQKAEFGIENHQNQKIVELKKHHHNFFRACVSDATNYSLMFPMNCDKLGRMLLFMAIIFMDYQYYENNCFEMTVFRFI